ncbi:MAG: DUF5049 domain-containing protein [Armatimonadota bacterium]
MSKLPVPVPKAVYDGLEAIRRSGLSNMLDRPRVIEIAELWGDDATAAWVRTHRAEYAQLIFRGVTIENEEGACAD